MDILLRENMASKRGRSGKHLGRLRRANDALRYLQASRHVKRVLRLSERRMRDLQEKRFLNLVRRAYAEVPFYRQIWSAAGVSAEDIRSMEDIGKLPIVSKQDVREGREAGLFPGTGECEGSMLLRTTGSTGEPLHIAWDRRAAVRMMAYFSRGYIGRHAGFKLRRGLFIVVLGRGDTMPPTSLDDPHHVPKNKRMVRGRYAFIDALEPMDSIIEFMKEWRPDYVGGYCSTFVSMALHAKKEGADIWRPKAMVLSGEPLSRQSLELIHDVFGGEVGMAYVTTETGPMAVDYPIGDGYRVFAQDIVVELVDDEGRKTPPGQVGNVVVTTLQNRVMPLIRYSGLADLATCDEEEGRSLLRLRTLQGRKVEVLPRRNGPPVGPFVLDVLMDEAHGIGQYQVVQHSLDEIEVIFVPIHKGHSSGKVDWMPVSSGLRELFGDQLTVRYTEVKTIPPKQGGVKTPLIVSYVR
jgi:phenylacetate-CoA ligase